MRRRKFLKSILGAAVTLPVAPSIAGFLLSRALTWLRPQDEWVTVGFRWEPTQMVFNVDGVETVYPIHYDRPPFAFLGGPLTLERKTDEV